MNLDTIICSALDNALCSNGDPIDWLMPHLQDGDFTIEQVNNYFAENYGKTDMYEYLDQAKLNYC